VTVDRLSATVDICR